MSSQQRLPDLLQHIRQAATDACGFVSGMSKDAFLADKRTQQAVILNLVIIGEAATRILNHHAGFAERHAAVPWRSMKGMRNRLAHGYFDIDLDVVWDTVTIALPNLLASLPSAVADPQGEPPTATPEAV